MKNYVAFVSDKEKSCFPVDYSNGIYFINTNDSVKLSYNESFLFDSLVKVHVPYGSVGHIFKSPDAEDDIEIIETKLNGGHWYDLNFKLLFKGLKSRYINGMWGLAQLKIVKLLNC